MNITNNRVILIAIIGVSGTIFLLFALFAIALQPIAPPAYGPIATTCANSGGVPSWGWGLFLIAIGIALICWQMTKLLTARNTLLHTKARALARQMPVALPVGRPAMQFHSRENSR